MRRIFHRLGALAGLALVGTCIALVAHAQTRPGRSGSVGVALQSATPGVTQNGNLHINGTASVGTLVTSTPIPGTFYVSGTVSLPGAIINQTPATPVLGVTKGATGHYTITGVTGMTVSSIIVGSVLESGSPGGMFTATPGTNSFTVTLVNGANGPVDNRFSFIVVAL